jgi:hypothetical protein
MRLIPIVVAGLSTAAAMAAVGWGLTGVAMVGPRAAVRIAAFAPQVEVTLLLVLGLPVWAGLLRAESSPAWRQALSATRRGRRLRVWRAATAQLQFVGTLILAGGFVWVLASLAGLGPSLVEIARVRLALLAFAVFGIGLGVWTRAAWPGAAAAVGACMLVLVTMAATPLAVAPLIAVAGAWQPLIQGSIMLNPWIVTAGISRLDILRMQWVYAMSPLGSVEASYPSLGLAVAVYGGAGVALLLLAVRALRRHGNVYGTGR